jgi:hypothetical protein
LSFDCTNEVAFCTVGQLIQTPPNHASDDCRHCKKGDGRNSIPLSNRHLWFFCIPAVCLAVVLKEKSLRPRRNAQEQDHSVLYPHYHKRKVATMTRQEFKTRIYIRDMETINSHFSFLLLFTHTHNGTTAATSFIRPDLLHNVTRTMSSPTSTSPAPSSSLQMPSA